MKGVDAAIRGNAHVHGRCRICHCTDANACAEGCMWVDHQRTLCSACAHFAAMTRKQVVIAALRACGLLPARERVSAGALETAIASASEVFDAFQSAGFAIALRPVKARTR